jgi:fructan beta-fructosidase
VNGDPHNTKWVLQVDLNPGAVAGGSGGQYFIGEFDGKRFTNDNPPDEIRWVDYGKDFYATQTWFNTNNRKVWIGWMNNWEYAEFIPTHPWRGAMSLPRELTLKTIPGKGIKLIQAPVIELQAIRQKPNEWKDQRITPGQNILSDISSNTIEIRAEFEIGSADEFGFKVRKGKNEETIIGYDTDRNQLFVDRTNSGEDQFHEQFAGKHTAPLHPVDNRIKLHNFVDHSSVEVFGNAGETTITDRIFPDPSSKSVELYVENGDVQLLSLTVNELDSIWQ